jgi:protein gp37
MNRTKIETVDWTWNPVTGCWGPGGTAEKPNWCRYCYAKKVANRFMTDRVADKIRESSPPQKGFMSPFYPVFYPERLPQPAKVKKSSKIFVCSMGDLFGDWVPEDWILKVLATIEFNAPHHTFQFFTKNPKRYQEFNPWPSNCWLLTTITNQQDADERIPELLKAQAPVLGVSVEPMLGPVDLTKIKFNGLYRDCLMGMPSLDWLIIGAMTGPGAKQYQPKPQWVQGLVEQARGADVPLFLKDNLKWGNRIQELPR